MTHTGRTFSLPVSRRRGLASRITISAYFYKEEAGLISDTIAMPRGSARHFAAAHFSIFDYLSQNYRRRYYILTSHHMPMTTASPFRLAHQPARATI